MTDSINPINPVNPVKSNTKIKVLSHTLTSVADDIIKSFRGRIHVVLTNVSYYDDEEMARIISHKKKEYPLFCTNFYSMPHNLADFLINFESVREYSGQRILVVIDNLNLFVSNLLLLYNSEYVSLDAIRNAIFNELIPLVKHRDTLGFDELIIFTSEVDFDYTVRTNLGRLYQQLLYEVNSFVAKYLADSYSLLTNGISIPLSLPPRSSL